MSCLLTGVVIPEVHTTSMVVMVRGTITLPTIHHQGLGPRPRLTYKAGPYSIANMLDTMIAMYKTDELLTYHAIALCESIHGV